MTASVLSPQTWPFSLEWLPASTYLVGGNVRDALLGRQAEYLDLDFVMPEGAVQTAKAIARHYQAGFVLLDAERQIARVVFDRATVDFAQQVGDRLEDDLRRRDFTVNAIAYNPYTEQLLDPLQGFADLQRHLIRMVSPENLKEDPLRLLRAYRQAAQLDFSLDPDTEQTIQQLADLLETIAAERVQAELSYLLSTAKGTPLLVRVWKDGLLAYWLPHTTAGGLARVAQVDGAAIALDQQWSDQGLEVTGWFRDQQRLSGTGRSWLKIAKLACLVAPDLELAEQELWQLKYSRAEVQSVLAVLKGFALLQTEEFPLSKRSQFILFRTIGAAFPALAVLAVASGIALETIAPLMQRFLLPDDPIAHPMPIVSGRDVMAALKLPAGPQIGKLLEMLQMARAEGTISTREEALTLAAKLLSGSELSGNGLSGNGLFGNEFLSSDR
ncbi:CCA tRNA nucleotidyltransferase [Leptolyngbya ohadii]|uniref:CCA tRNA nucleotidyltransferase n=1 Tax=Leptolyngbya ohadii TaxID=1962290 RepID=UPI000B59C8A3|nr:CCA tRNA nucleotidyltransferase [Leptolyngbya ohadii]